MPLWRLRVVADQKTLNPPDRITWGFGLEGSEAALTAAMTPLLTDFQNAVIAGATSGVRLLAQLQHGMRFTSLEAFPAAGGGAVAVAAFAPYTIANSQADMPAEVAVALSQNIMTTRGSRPRGRTFIGPLSTTVALSSGRPSANCITALGNFALSWHAALVGRGLTPCVISADGTTKRGNVIAYQVDNAFDSQRRRGWERTTISNFPV